MIKPKTFIDEIARESPLSNHFLRETRKPLFKYLATACEEAMRVAPLRNTLTRHVRFGKNVAFEHRHFVVPIS